MFLIGLYIRVSTQRQAKNEEGSLENQKQRLLYHLKSKYYGEKFEYVIYCDTASGKNTDSPRAARFTK